MEFKNIVFNDVIPAGGYDIKPSINTKCIVFTASLALGYWFLPKQNKLVLLALCYFPYLFLSYYDVRYDARRNMGPTYLADFYDFAKVPSSNQIKVWKNWSPRWKNRVRAVDLALLLVIVACSYSFLTWQTPVQKTQTPKEKHDDMVKGILFLAACVAVCVVCRFSLVQTEH